MRATVLCAAAIAVLVAGVARENTVPRGQRGPRQTAEIKTAATRRAAISPAGPAVKGKALASYDRLPLRFEANQGQTDSRVKFISRGPGYTLFLTADEAVLDLEKASAGQSVTRLRSADPEAVPGMSKSAAPTPSAALRLRLLGANASPLVAGAEPLPGASNYFIGNDARAWRRNVTGYARVRYESVYPGVNLEYYGNQRQLENDFVVAPGADPAVIRLRVDGARNVKIDASGDLLMSSAAGMARLRRPVIYQQGSGGRRDLVAGNYVLAGNHEIGFRVGLYDRSRALVLDPVLVYSSYLGGGELDFGNGVAVDASGELYITGFTRSVDFPTSAGSFQGSSGGNQDGFVTKVNAAGTALVYSTYLGGSLTDAGIAVAVDDSGNAFVTGDTHSKNFPTTTGAFQTTLLGRSSAFLTEFDPAGNLLYSSYLGGDQVSCGFGIALDATGVYIAGQTNAVSFPVSAGAFQLTKGGGLDGFVTKFAVANGQVGALAYSSYLGGSRVDFAFQVAVDSTGNAYVAGETLSTDFPTAAPFQAANAGGLDAFVSKVNSTGTALVYSSYLGGSSNEAAIGIAVDSSGSAYVAGGTRSRDFPVTAGALQSKFGGNKDAFVTKFSPDGSALTYSTYLGGGGLELAEAITVDAAGDAYVTGCTKSVKFPLKNPIQATYGGGTFAGDAFVSELNPAGSQLLFSTYVGGSGDDAGYGVAVDAGGNIYVGGITLSTNFPVTGGAMQGTFGGVEDGFVAKIAPSAVMLSSSALNFGGVAIGSSATQMVTLTNIGSSTLTFTSITIGGKNPGDFSQTSNCLGGVPAGGSCTLNITFTPTSMNERHASVVLTDSDPTSPQIILVSGNGT